eukprot:m.32054 g.32054  ORF g.32054 m.32054 type:complete len:832 (+) comp31589_c0_seq8:1605-4100(+)
MGIFLVKPGLRLRASCRLIRATVIVSGYCMKMSSASAFVPRDNDFLGEFLDESFDPKHFASAAIQSRIVGESLEKLSAGIHKLDKELHAQVVSHHSDLLSQATGIETLEGVLQMMQARIDSLRKAIDRMKIRVVEPFEKITTRTAQLQRLQSACDLLRKVIRVIYLVKRLHTLLQGGSRELAKAAQSLYELLELFNDSDLKGIQVVERDRVWVGKAQDEIEKQAQAMLISGLESQNPTQLGVALQVYYNLECLGVRMERVRRLWVNRLQDSVRKALDPSQITQAKTPGGTFGPGRVDMPALGSSAQWRANLWTRMEQMTNSIDAAFGQVYHLQKVIAKKRDPVTQIAFAEELCKDRSTLDVFWESVLVLVEEELSVAAHASTFIKQAFESEYPKLLRLFNDLGSRLSQRQPIIIQSTTLNPTDPPTDVSITKCLEKSAAYSFGKTLSHFEAAYIARSLSRLLDSVNVVFPAGSKLPPSKDEIAGIVKTMTNELSTVVFDDRLLKIVSSNASKAVKTMTAKSEQLISYGLDAKQVSAAPSQAQKTNLAVMNSLYFLVHKVKSSLLTLVNLSDAALEVIQLSLEAAELMVHDVGNILINEIATTVEEILFSMHDVDFSGDASTVVSDQIPEAPCSAYIAELKDFISRMYSTHLINYECTKHVEKRLFDLAGRIIELFVRHVSLIRPLGEKGKLRLAADFTQVELAVTPLCPRPADLGSTYQALKAFKSILFIDFHSLPTNSMVTCRMVPLSSVIHVLFSASPQTLKSPNQLAGWNLRQYSNWLDEHPSEGDRLAMISATLESYVRAVRAEGQRQFAPQYLVMVELLTADASSK